MKLRTLVVLAGLGAHAARKLRDEARGDAAPAEPATGAGPPLAATDAAPEPALPGATAVEPQLGAPVDTPPAAPPEDEPYVEHLEPAFPTVVEPEPVSQEAEPWPASVEPAAPDETPASEPPLEAAPAEPAVPEPVPWQEPALPAEAPPVEPVSPPEVETEPPHVAPPQLEQPSEPAAWTEPAPPAAPFPEAPVWAPEPQHEALLPPEPAVQERVEPAPWEAGPEAPVEEPVEHVSAYDPAVAEPVDSDPAGPELLDPLEQGDRSWPYSLLYESEAAAEDDVDLAAPAAYEGETLSPEAGPDALLRDEPEAALVPHEEPTAAAAPSEPAAAAEPVAEEPEISSGALDEDLPDGWAVVVYPDEERAEDGAEAPPAAAAPVGSFHGLAEVTGYLQANETPVALVAPTPFALCGIGRWVQGFSSVSHYDVFDGRDPTVFVPSGLDPGPYPSTAAICKRLLEHPQVAERLSAHSRGRVVLPEGDAETDALVEALGLRLAGAGTRLRRRLESRIELTRLAADAGVPCVPHVLGHAATWKELLLLAQAKTLGEDLVVQTAFRGPGPSTFAIAGAEDWAEHEDRIVGEQLKVMPRITPKDVVVGGIVTRHGPVVATGFVRVAAFPHVVPYAGGWCLGEAEPGALQPDQRDRARRYTRLIGERLRREGFLGAYEAEIVIDEGTGEVYLGGLVAGFGAASAMANVAAVGGGEMPVQVLHLLEHLDVDYSLDVDELNRLSEQTAGAQAWSVLVLVDTADVVELITEAPSSGIWRFEESAQGGIEYVRPESTWATVAGEDEAFYLRMSAAGQYRHAGAPLGVLVVRGTLLDEERRLDERALRWIRGLKKNFWTAPAPPDAPVPEPAPFRFSLP